MDFMKRLAQGKMLSVQSRNVMMLDLKTSNPGGLRQVVFVSVDIIVNTMLLLMHMFGDNRYLTNGTSLLRGITLRVIG